MENMLCLNMLRVVSSGLNLRNFLSFKEDFSLEIFLWKIFFTLNFSIWLKKNIFLFFLKKYYFFQSYRISFLLYKNWGSLRGWYIIKIPKSWKGMRIKIPKIFFSFLRYFFFRIFFFIEIFHHQRSQDLCFKFFFKKVHFR